MRDAWHKLAECIPIRAENWLEEMLERNADCAYLLQYHSPRTLKDFRKQVPLVTYDEILPWIQRIAEGNEDVLFAGAPVGYEHTGGTTRGRKLIPYTQEGLQDLRHILLGWLLRLTHQYQLSGSVYFSLSPACRAPETLGEIPVGLNDLQYFGNQAASIIADLLAVPPQVGEIEDVQEWKQQSLHYLQQAKDLELISAWSPTFLLMMFEGVDTQRYWPELKVISCWADAGATQFIPRLQALFPHAYIEPKGLLSTEAVITVPNAQGQSVLVDIGLVEFRQGSGVYLAGELIVHETYEVVVTTNSGLYRYCTGDQVRYDGLDDSEKPILKFMGRSGVTSDLVGEKLTEGFVADCCKEIEGFRMLIPNAQSNGYMLVSEHAYTAAQLAMIESRLCRNPQYAYARNIGQLQQIASLVDPKAWCYYEKHMQRLGQRLGDIKPVSLRTEPYWIRVFGK